MSNPHQVYSASPSEMVSSIWRNRQLIVRMTNREVIGRYRGSIMGLAWSLFNPVLMLIVYTFVFSVIFKSRWGDGADESKASFAMILFVGMIMHGLFAECVNRAPSLILSNANFVKKVVFPIEILPCVAMGSALFHSAMSLLVLLLAQLLINHALPWTVLLFPLVALPLLLATMGFAWFLAALGVYARDIGQITGIITTILLFLSPVFFPVSALPEQHRVWMRLNPLTPVIEQARDVLIFGRVPALAEWLVTLFASLLIASGGFWWFQKTRRGFADVV